MLEGEQADIIQQAIDRMLDINTEIKKLKSEYDELEALLLKQSEEDLTDTKLKSVSYAGVKGEAISTTADSVKILYPTYLRKIFGAAYSDVVTEKTTYALTNSATRMVAGIWKKEYIKESFDDIIAQMNISESARETLAKKLKGTNFESDKKNLMKIGGMNEEDADRYAYFLQEAEVWDSFVNLMELTSEHSMLDFDNKDKETAMKSRINETIKLIDTVFAVEQNPKVALKEHKKARK